MNLADPSANATTREATCPLLIVGASARAAAASAARAGFAPLAIDRFNDVDLGQLCSERRAYCSLSDIPHLASELPEADWMYTGPLENHAQLLRTLSERRCLLGNNADTVQQVRDPWRLHACLRAAGLPSPLVSRSARPFHGQLWLKKPLRSAGGIGIEECLPNRTEQPAAAISSSVRPCYYQQHIGGPSFSAVFVAAREQATLLGVTEQLTGTTWNAAPYQYAGSIGPVVLPAEAEAQLCQAGTVVSQRFELQGIFGMDFILFENAVWPVEVNPRYSASVEVIELTNESPLLAYHVLACRERRLPDVDPTASTLVSGKLILYATQPLRVSESTVQRVAGGSDATIADIPRLGTQIAPGDPICTILLTATTVDDVRSQLAGWVGALE